ncbi:MAG TPA: hypothetical protein PK280_06095 [Planctomycetota bacterium]|nr:hypothetical protein [Planctomycetota bacterium]
MREACRLAGKLAAGRSAPKQLSAEVRESWHRAEPPPTSDEAELLLEVCGAPPSEVGAEKAEAVRMFVVNLLGFAGLSDPFPQAVVADLERLTFRMHPKAVVRDGVPESVRAEMGVLVTA